MILLRHIVITPRLVGPPTMHPSYHYRQALLPVLKALPQGTLSSWPTSELHYLADENWNFSAMHPLNHIPLSLMEEKALWQYTRYVYSNQVDTYTFDQLLSGITERIEEQWQISISPDDLEIRYDENQGLEVFQVTPDQPFWNLRNLLDEYRPQWQTHQFSATTLFGRPCPPATARDLMVTETNLETGRSREHQVEFFFFKLVGDWPMAQRMGNYWRQHYGLDRLMHLRQHLLPVHQPCQLMLLIPQRQWLYN
eukprot:s826_g30.t1